MKPRFSLVGRYSFISLTLMIGSVAVLSALYTAVSDSVNERLAGERLEAQVAGNANRLTNFIENRVYQLETLSTHPSMPLYLAYSEAVPEGVRELVRVEADSPDLYGILFFDSGNNLLEVVPGQAASGSPYWNREGWTLAGLPVIDFGISEIIGPSLPGSGGPAWLLIRQPLRAGAEQAVQGAIALHVRLASLTELMRTENLAGVLRPYLRTPDGELLDATGNLQATVPKGLRTGPEVLPGWRIDYVVSAGEILSPLRNAQLGLYALAGVLALGTVILFWALARSLRRRVARLTEGAEAFASGDLHFRLQAPKNDNDEIDVLAHAFNAMADRLQEMIQRTVQAEKMAVLGEFATGVAHEVRNPLATIKLTVQALERREPDKQRRELLISVEDEIDRLNRVVGDLLDYGRPVPGEAQQVEIRRVFRHARVLTSGLADSRQVTVSATGDSSLTIHASPDQTIQCLVNLVANAIQACEPGGIVHLRAYRNGNCLTVEITDNGSGMSGETLSRVAEPFFTTRSDGTGLGLSISRQLIELNRGEMDIRSMPGQGTTVLVTLPAGKSGNLTTDQ
ncbi:HAMP domain-containing sensor histidine kinase [Marinobacter sp. M216]|uniref:histidine kinase n=1 Tax=Marinobacter albus TaxID=3030833 RepID=A0ABT7H8U0_9GAMM|nr:MULTISPECIES: HAMP domain-containing sensor histidine kinase [unclassified Marinobacter]MBW7471279.1 HAMP domain-containing histidine kinase [Marinobacter sp. F4218]MDK9556444.1 HAMP domain-containing sensor histidine kinase [Marinobacter sp. M216]